MIKLSYAQSKRAVLAGLKSRVSVLLEGAPGGGKTSLVRACARELGIPCYDLIGANLDPTDVAGLPYRDANGNVARALFPEIQKCVTEPGILFLDELTTAPPSVRAALLRLLLERNAGGTPLHPETRVLAACNAVDHAPNATELDAASLNRVCRIYYSPAVDEVAGYFSGSGVIQANLTPTDIGTALPDIDWAAEAHDFAATLAVDPSLLSIEPPQASVESGAAWGSPRAWELGLRIWAADGSQVDETGYAILAGCVGETAATAYLAIRKLRGHLPTADAIEADPAGALVPDQATYQVAAVGLIARVARGDLSAAWVYAERLRPEIGAALAQILIKSAPTKPSKHKAAGMKAQISLMAKVHKATH